MSHVNIQINIQYVNDTTVIPTAYIRGSAEKAVERKVREERINVSGSTAAAAFKRAKNALEVLSDSE